MVKVIRKSLRLRQSLKNNIFAASTELELVFFEIAETDLFSKIAVVSSSFRNN